jgi:hypothetical protein
MTVASNSSRHLLSQKIAAIILSDTFFQLIRKNARKLARSLKIKRAVVVQSIAIITQPE